MLILAKLGKSFIPAGLSDSQDSVWCRLAWVVACLTGQINHLPPGCHLDAAPRAHPSVGMSWVR
jgi:hypothetical protein